MTIKIDSNKAKPKPTDCYARSASFYHTRWRNCRVWTHEDFTIAALINRGEKFLYYSPEPKQSLQEIYKLLDEIENKLGLSEADQIKFDADNGYMELSEWWCDPIRLNFLTAFLRDAFGTIKKTIENGKYLSKTSSATERFLKKNVFYHGHEFHGWVDDLAAAPDLLKDTPAGHDIVHVRYYQGWTLRDLKLCKR